LLIKVVSEGGDASFRDFNGSSFAGRGCSLGVLPQSIPQSIVGGQSINL